MPPKKKKDKQLTLEEIIRKQFLAKCRFRAVVRFVILNLYWLQDPEDTELGDDVNRNVYILTRKKTAKELTLHDKSILNTSNELRTEEDKIHLNRVIGGLKCFRIYPSYVKAELAGVTYFIYYPAGRVIVREGHEADALYFIISGIVAVSNLEYDPGTETYVDTVISRLESGEMFGELSLLHGIPRTTTITTITDCEFLLLKKEDFSKVLLKSCLEDLWNKITSSMKMFTYFAQWDDFSLRNACVIGKMLYFKKDEVILGDGKGMKDYVYFIINGECRIVHHLYVQTKMIKNKKVSKLYHPAEVVDGIEVASKQSAEPTTTDIELPPDVEVHFIQVCALKATACFNLGENLSQKRILTAAPTECLLIPRYWLMKKNFGNIWNRIVNFLNSQIPDNKEVFKHFLLQKKWICYRKALANDILSKKNSMGACAYSDIPVYIRINN